MKYNGVLIAVSDMENSRRFYRDVLGLKAVEDFGANVTLEGGIFRGWLSRKEYAGE